MELMRKWKNRWDEHDKGRYCHSILPVPLKVPWFKESGLR
jgi:hypothetical protein